MENPHLVSPSDLRKSEHIVQSSAKPQKKSLYSPKLPSSVKNKQTNKQTKTQEQQTRLKQNKKHPWYLEYIYTHVHSRQASSGNNLC